MTVAEREQQCMEALAVANAIRMSNARLRREIAALDYEAGAAKVIAVLDEPSGPVGSIKVGMLLRCIHGVGELKMAQLLRHAGIFSVTRRVGTLTPRQRRALAQVLREPYLIWPGTNKAAVA